MSKLVSKLSFGIEKGKISYSKSRKGSNNAPFFYKLKDKNIQELALAMLYLGEGFKKDQQLGLGNCNPLILRFFIKVYLDNFTAVRTTIKCDLYLRADQDIDESKRYWANELNLPIENFKYMHYDKRTLGSTTRSNYKGVCALRCGHLAVKRKIMYIAEKYCEPIIKGG